MINSELHGEMRKRKDDYPILKYVENDDGIMVVLFTDKKTGMVVKARPKADPVGYICDCWGEIGFDLYEGFVTLGNEK